MQPGCCVRRCEYAADYDTATPHVLNFGKMPDAERQVLPLRPELSRMRVRPRLAAVARDEPSPPAEAAFQRLVHSNVMHLRWYTSASSAETVQRSRRRVCDDASFTAVCKITL